MARKIEGQVKDLDGFSVTRILPHKEQRMVGPFTFLDHMGLLISRRARALMFVLIPTLA
ncbi:MULTISPECIES: hypothetical protein [unclassified Oleiphilus]|uniref:hypothetical protein n=1 Tax=unclassified Oleiphilus TaxID=2631174 RepID=UPI000AB6EDDD|nr:MULTISPECIES: hypothetical protein [unclassified Oleiphilus]